MVTERTRHELHVRLTDVIGDESAGTLMELLPPFPWHEIATKEVVRTECEMVRVEIGGRVDRVGGRIDGLTGRIEGVEEGLIGRIDGVEEGLTGRIDGLTGRIDGVEGQLVGIRAEIAASSKALFARLLIAYFLMSIALAGLILAAVSIPQ